MSFEDAGAGSAPKSHPLIAASRVAGTTVYNPAGEKLGVVQDVMIDRRAGRIVYAVLSFGGFLGLGERRHPVPWSSLRYDTELGGYVIDIDRSVLEGSPAFADDEPIAWDEQAWARSLHDYYKAEPFWLTP